MFFQPEVVSLSDGTPVIIRAIRHKDAPLLAAMHERLSQHSFLMRYLGVARRPVIEQVATMCDINFTTRMAFVAIPTRVQPKQIVGMACYIIPSQETPHSAEVGIVVEDVFQHRGLGSILLIRLALYAQAHGIYELTADASYDNRDILAFIRKTHLPHHVSAAGGMIHILVTINGYSPESILSG